ncbi:hypothetical protein CKO32_05705 [Afifella marina DSM 2698]|uniref:Uncharacterized protein n=1 Tax=Afifella marina DSM 2698 TaxID=1120955 RepID=A0A1G5M556_AFIMA|nr:hypothetical protein [Afifella marina DSM 2698]MBK1626050.1 hypothetical protein [Afifella marina]MBK5917874.1 hypothetical protein [Afifella marina]RAI18191.1 hypothetical protein CH311_15960 [Afifella marina DSM 2698]SCZ19509.1 hypothetical protein SAMN03080610_00023 [Afifella marina DSM 2698]
MARSVKDVAELKARMAHALSSDNVSVPQREFLESQKARLDQRGTHTMLTDDQLARIERIIDEAGAELSSSGANPSDADDAESTPPTNQG